MDNFQKEIDERTNLTASNKFELLLFRLGIDSALGKSELFGINVFKVREVGLNDFYARVIVNPQGRLNLQDIVKTEEATAAPPAASASI